MSPSESSSKLDHHITNTNFIDCLNISYIQLDNIMKDKLGVDGLRGREGADAVFRREGPDVALCL